MNDLSQILKNGTLLIIETGEYSDSDWGGPVRMLADYTKAELAEQYVKEWKPEYDGQTGPDPMDLLPWLIRTGKAEAVDNVETWWVGAYSYFNPEGDD